MPLIPPSYQWSRDPLNELHKASVLGSTERVVALLLDESMDINQGNPMGWTPLMFASCHSHVARILLNKGAEVSIVGDGGYAALHISAQEGHLVTSKMLVDAGATLDAASVEGNKALHLAAQGGHLGVTVC